MVSSETEGTFKGDAIPADGVTTNGSAIGKPYEEKIGALDIYESYKKSPFLSIKHSSYFQVYAELFEQYRDRPITFVEVGVLNGGSLFMWRDYFGPKARIIGIDLNPLAKKWEKDNFEIHIGSQSDPQFWESFFNATGPVDVVLDDGGHTFEQQVITTHACIPNIKNGGVMIVEDTHTSYFPEFGYPTKYSFIEWTKKLIDNINSRFPSVSASTLPYKNSVYSISFFESIVCLKIDRNKCFQCVPTSNGGVTSNAQDFRYKDSAVEKIPGIISGVARRFPFLTRISRLRVLKNKVIGWFSAYDAKSKIRKYF